MNTGDKVKFIGTTNDQVNWCGHDDPRKYLIKGKEYTISKIEVHSWHTRVYLKEYPGKHFNLLSFEVIAGQQP